MSFSQLRLKICCTFYDGLINNRLDRWPTSVFFQERKEINNPHKWHAVKGVGVCVRVWAGGWDVDGVTALAGGRRCLLLMDEGISPGRGQVAEQSGKAALMGGWGGVQVWRRSTNW